VRASLTRSVAVVVGAGDAAVLAGERAQVLAIGALLGET
jgi:hypothetical protein